MKHCLFPDIFPLSFENILAVKNQQAGITVRHFESVYYLACHIYNSRD